MIISVALPRSSTSLGPSYELCGYQDLVAAHVDGVLTVAEHQEGEHHC